MVLFLEKEYICVFVKVYLVLLYFEYSGLACRFVVAG